MIPRLYGALGAGLLITAAVVAGGRFTYNMGWEARDAKALREEALIATAARAAQESAAQAISRMKVQHVTIRQELEKEIRENVVYRECVASERVFQLSNAAITGESLPADPGRMQRTGPPD